MRTRNSIRAFDRPSVRPSVREHELKSVKTRISAPAHLSATGGHVSSLVTVFLRGLWPHSSNSNTAPANLHATTFEQFFHPSLTIAEAAAAEGMKVLAVVVSGRYSTWKAFCQRNKAVHTTTVTDG